MSLPRRSQPRQGKRGGAASVQVQPSRRAAAALGKAAPGLAALEPAPDPGRGAPLAWIAEQAAVPGRLPSRTGQHVQQLSPDRLAALYRALQKALEDSKNAPGSANFYYGEVEMRRFSPNSSWRDRLLLWVNWLFSGLRTAGQPRPARLRAPGPDLCDRLLALGPEFAGQGAAADRLQDRAPAQLR